MRCYLALVRQGLHDHRLAPVTWGGSLGAMSALMVAIWPTIEDTASELVRQYPKGLREAFGIRDLASVEEYVDAEMLSLIVPLALCFFAARCAADALVGAEERHHLDTLLSLPVDRRVVVAAALTVTGVLVLAVLGVVWVAAWVAGVLVGSGIDAGALALGLLNVWPLTTTVAGLAIAASGVLHRLGTVAGVAMGVTLAMYVLDLAGKLADDVEPLRVVSAFRYYGSAIQDGMDLSHVTGLTLAGLALAALGAIAFARRDIR